MMNAARMPSSSARLTDTGLSAGSARNFQPPPELRVMVRSIQMFSGYTSGL